MAKKTLLTEGEFKKFMKLARLEPLAAEKLAEMYSAPAKADDEEEDVTAEGRKTKKPKKVMREEELELDEDLAALFEEDDEMRGGEEETAMEPVGEPMDDEMDMPDVEMTDDDMGGDEASELKAGIESSLEDLLGKLDQLMDMAGAGDMMDVETDEEGDEGIEGDEGGDAEMGAALPAPEDDMASLEETVLRRVASRLQRESKVDAKSDLIAERIMKRLKNL
jgi:hypothetical protein